MRKWLVDKLFSLALRIDEVETTILARLWVDADNFNRMMEALIKDMTASIEKPKRGRGRPKGSKNKPKVGA